MYNDLDPLLHSQLRLAIMSLLVASEKAEFTHIKEETKATIRCIPFNEKHKGVKCVYSGKPAKYEVIFAKSY